MGIYHKMDLAVTTKNVWEGNPVATAPGTVSGVAQSGQIASWHYEGTEKTKQIAQRGFFSIRGLVTTRQAGKLLVAQSLQQ